MRGAGAVPMLAAMPEIVLWGPSEHDSDADRAALTAALRDRRLDVLALPLGAPPPRAAQVVVINTKTRIDRAALAAMPQLQLVITTTSGHDHIDVAAARERGVMVARCPLARRDAVVDASVALALALLRRLPRMAAAARAGRWMRREVKDHPMPLVRELCVGVFGLGVIGKRAVEVWRALGAEVLGADPAVAGSHARDQLLARCDILTLHCSLTASSAGLLDAAAIAALRPGAILVNTARGECIDLAAAIAAPHLGGLGLDVFTSEPPPELAQLAAHDHVIVTPHSAGYHQGLGKAIHAEVLSIVDRWQANLPPPHPVVDAAPTPRS